MTPGHQPPTEKSPVTVLGLGPMGKSLAGAFLAAGHPTTVWNRTPGKAGDLVARGAVEAATVEEAVAASPRTVLCVIDGAAARATVAPAAVALKGRTLVNLTTGSPADARALAAWAEERGIAYLDGSIMTPTDTIGTDAASVLYSGPAELFEAHAPALAALGGAATYLVADPGRAAAYEVALLDLFWTAMAGYAHAVALARAEGITAADLAPHAKGIAGILPDIIDDLAARIDAGRHTGDDSTVRSASAGMAHILHAAEARGLDTSVLTAARGLAERVVAEGHGDDGFSRIAELLARPVST